MIVTSRHITDISKVHSWHETGVALQGECVEAHAGDAADAHVLGAGIDGEGEEAERHVDDDGVRIAGGEGGFEAPGGRVEQHRDGDEHGGRIHVHARHCVDDRAAAQHQQRAHDQIGHQGKAEEHLRRHGSDFKMGMRIAFRVCKRLEAEKVQSLS